jgi:integrase
LISPAIALFPLDRYVAEIDETAQPGAGARDVDRCIKLEIDRRIDLGERLWIVPASRMEAAREHRVPLKAAAIAVPDGMRMAAGPGSSTGMGFVFAGGRAGRPLSNMALSMLLRRMGRGELTVHGFRSTFRDWAGERTSFARDLAEMALAHIVGDKVEAAYRRGDGLRKRRQMIEAWGAFGGVHQLVTGEIVALRQAAQ